MTDAAADLGAPTVPARVLSSWLRAHRSLFVVDLAKTYHLEMLGVMLHPKSTPWKARDTSLGTLYANLYANLDTQELSTPNARQELKR